MLPEIFAELRAEREKLLASKPAISQRLAEAQRSIEILAANLDETKTRIGTLTALLAAYGEPMAEHEEISSR